MKAYQIYWVEKSKKRNAKSGSTVVIHETIMKAIARFQGEFHPDRVIESIYNEGDEVLLP